MAAEATKSNDQLDDIPWSYTIGTRDPNILKNIPKNYG
eukprot:CAMPEP_0114598350 /NCGR_PEP_ID=MMETSP0125-20121206/20672_1 /TAXON_ID=485358 ORGANISM="Aristerostoma sp., Strain ATCC 50986" /NCGR_SAMPLE_ID=MMETSP0125 /ASSEMBLY_ACC=CAM_ASM_000245 /LENGTH=37 /DNA_ID= /DNA_START= /DNA_END= /DNA_ORIENTATION=